MCPNTYLIKDLAGMVRRTPPDPRQIPLPLLENGLTDSPGPTGPPSHSELDAPDIAPATIPEIADEDGVSLVRHHKGLSSIQASFLHLSEACPGTFSALRRGALDGYTVTLSCNLTSTEYAALVQTLETTPSTVGESVSVALKFEPMTPNLVPPTTAPNI